MLSTSFMLTAGIFLLTSADICSSKTYSAAAVQIATDSCSACVCICVSRASIYLISDPG